MVQLTAHFDGKVLIPDEPVELPTGVPLQITVKTKERNGYSALLALDGLGKEIWEGIDGVEYQRQERQGWD